MYTLHYFVCKNYHNLQSNIIYVSLQNFCNYPTYFLNLIKHKSLTYLTLFMLKCLCTIGRITKTSKKPLYIV